MSELPRSLSINQLMKVFVFAVENYFKISPEFAGRSKVNNMTQSEISCGLYSSIQTWLG